MSIEDSGESWDKQAPNWVNHKEFGFLRKSFEKICSNHTKEILQELPLGSTILDIGAGALNSCYFEEREDLSLISTDGSFEMLKLNASERKAQANACDYLPFASESIDLCTSYFLMRYLTGEQKVFLLEEIKRVLKPNSWFLIIDQPTNRWKNQVSVFNPENIAKYANNLGFTETSGETKSYPAYENYIPTGFGGLTETINYTIGTIKGKKGIAEASIQNIMK